MQSAPETWEGPSCVLRPSSSSSSLCEAPCPETAATQVPPPNKLFFYDLEHLFIWEPHAGSHVHRSFPLPSA